MQTYQAELILDTQSVLGEGPIWDERESVLWWIDINQHLLHRYDPSSGENKTFDVGQRVGAVVPRASGGLMLAVQNGLASYDPATGSLEIVTDPEADKPQNRFNDGKCDPAGRFWAGTLELVEKNMQAGTLYCLYADGRVEPRVPEVGISNGIVWTSDKQTMYYIDTPTRRVDAFDYDNDTGEISNRRCAIDVPADLGYPDGMTIDSDDKLWVALWGGWGVVQFDPTTGEALAKVDVPASQTTACAFAGETSSDLYITCARRDLEGDKLAAEPHAGGLFRAGVSATGCKTNQFAG